MRIKLCRKTPLLSVAILTLGILLTFTVAFAGATSWLQVNENGFGNPDNWATNSLVKFKGNLYAFTDDGIFRTEKEIAWSKVNNTGASHGIAFKGQLYGIAGDEVWRSLDGINWEQIAEIPIDEYTWIAATGVFENKLYLSTASSLYYAGEFGEQIGARVWKTTNGSNWMELENLPVTGQIRTIKGFKGQLYLGAISQAPENWEGPFSIHSEVWRSKDDAIWEQVASDGFGDARNTGPLSLIVFKDWLYTSTWRGGWEGYPSTGTEIWRTRDGLSWMQVNDEGFGDPGNHMSYLAAGEDKLFAGTSKGGGLEVWESSNGTAWTQIADEGFGDSANSHTYCLVSFDNRLFVGTWSPFTGTQVWSY